MGFLRTILYYLGIVAGLATVAAAGAVLLTYLFTGKVPVFNQTGEDKMKMVLMTPDEVAAFVREQARKAEAAVEAQA